jgi:hypothetical protein
LAHPKRRPADSAGQRWAVSTGVGRRWLMTFRWLQSAGRAQSLRHRHVRRPTDCTASVADMSSRVNPGPRRSTRTCAPSARKATASASVSRVTSAGSGVNRSTSCVGRSTKSWASIAPPPARATCPASGNAKAIRAICSCSGSRLTRRRHQAEAPTPVVRVAAAIAGAKAAAAPRD